MLVPLIAIDIRTEFPATNKFELCFTIKYTLPSIIEEFINVLDKSGSRENSV